MTLFQIMAAIFGLWMLYEISIHAKKKTLSTIEATGWGSLWFVFIVIALFPNLLFGIAHSLHFSRVFDLLVVGTLIILTTIIFFSYFAQKEAQAKLRKLVKDLALKEVKSPKGAN